MWYRLKIPLLIAFGIGLLAFAHDYVPHPIANQFREEMTSWFRIIGGFALLLGIYSLAAMHVGRITRRQAGWAYSVFVFIGAGAMIAFGMYNQGRGPLGPAPGSGSSFMWLYHNVQVPCSATIFSMLAFFMASAAFRTFRARNLEAALLLAAAIIVMFGRVTISELVSDIFPKAANLLMDYPNTAAKRGIMLGISLGAISQSVRILFGLERSYLGGGD